MDCTIYLANIKGADQLRGNCLADLRLSTVFAYAKEGFLTTRLISQQQKTIRCNLNIRGCFFVCFFLFSV